MLRRNRIRRPSIRHGAFERLEDRLTLDGDEYLWGVDARLSISFAPDGALVAGSSSNLFEKLAPVAPTDIWQDAILRGFQTWARQTNADIGMVSEEPCVPPAVTSPGPCPFGAPGALQQDPRFGDIRVGAIPLDDELFAVSISSAEAIDGTWAGDVLFNSTYLGKDGLTVDELFRIAVHEAGHVFGLEHSDNPQSPMHQHGIPASVVPSPEDIAALHAIFGAREQDVYDRSGGGGGHPLGVPVYPFEVRDDAPDGSAPTIAFADLSDQQDQDTYFLRLEDLDGYTNGTLSFQVITSGISQLAPRLELRKVLSPFPLVTEVVIPDPGSANPAAGTAGEDLEIRVTGLDGQDQIQIVVDTPSTDLSQTGGYTLLIWYEGLIDPTITPAVLDDLVRQPIRMIAMDEIEDYFEDGFQLLVNDDGGLNDLPGMETEFEPPAGSSSARYQTSASIEIAADVDRYRVRSPESLVAGRDMATVFFRSADPQFTGSLTLYDEQGATISSEVLVWNEQTIGHQFGPILANQDYFVKIEGAASSSVATGSYEFQALMGTTAIARAQFASGVMTASAVTQSYQLRTIRPQLFQFALSAESGTPAAAATVRMEILDLRGNLVASLETTAGATRSKSVLLPRGHYRVQFRVTSGSLPVNFSLRGSAVDNPLGPRIDDGSTPYTFIRVRGILIPIVAFGS